METTGKTVNIPKLEISPAERTEEKLTPESVAAAARLLRETGLVVIESVLPRDWIAELNVAMQTVLDNEAGAQNGAHPMLKMPFMDARIINNPFAMPILKRRWVRKSSPICHTDATLLSPAAARNTSIAIQDNSSPNCRSRCPFRRLS